MHSPVGKIAHLAVAATLTLWMLAGYAIREEKTFEVTVSIPTPDFYVLPNDPGFLEREQKMGWDINRKTLLPLSTSFDVRNANGGITARLGHDPVLSSGSELINLDVRFNNQLLTLNDTQVVTESEAKAGLRVPLKIEAIEPQDGFVGGEYFGSVQIIFDAQLGSG